MNTDVEKIQVVGVCGNEAFVYELPDGSGIRRVLEKKVFSNRGQAVQFAVEFEAKQRERRKSTKEVDVEIKRKSRKQIEGVQE